MAADGYDRCPFCATPLGEGDERCPECGCVPKTAELADDPGRPSAPSGLELDAPTGADRACVEPPPARRPSAPPPGPRPASGDKPVDVAKAFPEYAKRATLKERIVGGGRALVTIALVLAVTAGVYFYFFGLSLPSSCCEPAPDHIAVGDSVPGELSFVQPRRTYELDLGEPADVTIAVDGDFDSVLEVHRGQGQAPWATDDDSGPGHNPLISGELARGTYSVVVRGSSGARGAYTLSITRQ